MFFSDKLGFSISELDVNLSSTFDYLLSEESSNVGGNLATESSVIHHKRFQVSEVVDEELPEAVGENVSCVSRIAVSDFDSGLVSLIFSSKSVINASWLPPAWLDPSGVDIAFESCELLASFLCFADLHYWLDAHLYPFISF